jgi:hypothetical protein
MAGTSVRAGGRDIPGEGRAVLLSRVRGGPLELRVQLERALSESADQWRPNTFVVTVAELLLGFGS